MTRAALIISDLQGGDYQVVLVDEERFAQIKEANETEREGFDAGDVIAYLVGDEKDSSAAHAQRPDLYPACRGRVLGSKFTQDHVIEASEDWPEVRIFAILSVPCT